jgi:hypothetical protein
MAAVCLALKYLRTNFDFNLPYVTLSVIEIVSDSANFLATFGGESEDGYSCYHSGFVIVCDGVSTEPEGHDAGGKQAASMLTFELEQILERRFQSQSKNNYVNAIKKVMRIANYHSNHSNWLQSMIMYTLYKTPWWGSTMMAVVSTAGRNFLIVYNGVSVRVELWRRNQQIGRTQEANMQTQTTMQAHCTPIVSGVGRSV